MTVTEIKDRKVLKYLYEKNQTYIKWMQYVVDHGQYCDDMSWSNYESAKRQIKNLEQQNKDILEELGNG